MNKPDALVVFATMDPRCNKVGGIETHVRVLLRNHPAGMKAILVGIDEIGDLPLGMPMDLSIGERQITFLPVAHVPGEQASNAASRLFRSTTLRFALGAVRHMRTLRGLVAGKNATADLPRVEFAPLAKLAGLPFVLMIHSDLDALEKTETLLKRYRLVKSITERMAFSMAGHVFAVSPQILANLQAHYPFLSGKSGVMSVPVDTHMFHPAPFPDHDLFRIIYAGRFDAIKDPGMMFEVIRRLTERLDGMVEFNLISAGEPFLYSQFPAIRAVTKWHGRMDAKNVARVMRASHCAIMTSHSEGLPAFLLESLASGRPMGALHLPTFEALVRPGETGILAARGSTDDETADRLVEALLRLREQMREGTICPDRVAQSIDAYSVDAVLGRLFDAHQRLREAA